MWLLDETLKKVKKLLVLCLNRRVVDSKKAEVALVLVGMIQILFLEHKRSELTSGVCLLIAEH